MIRIITILWEASVKCCGSLLCLPVQHTLHQTLCSMTRPFGILPQRVLSFGKQRSGHHLNLEKASIFRLSASSELGQLLLNFMHLTGPPTPPPSPPPKPIQHHHPKPEGWVPLFVHLSLEQTLGCTKSLSIFNRPITFGLILLYTML